MRPIGLLAIVNRGEAAMRCIRAVRSLRIREGSGLRTLALYTDPDREAPFVRAADRAVRLTTDQGPVAAYLDLDRLVATLRSAGVDAVWPGWGFVAEDPEFAERLEEAGIRFLGPSPEALRTLGDKITAKHLAEKAGVPVAAWSGGAVPDLRSARQAAQRIGTPFLVKAAAGGGGRGIRRVADLEALPAALDAAGAEAESAFGDGRLFLEAEVESGRHVEVQIAADEHGHVLALGARDCSVQRRRQKLVEEAPPPSLGRELRRTLDEAALLIARAAGYVGVGTVEFLVSGTDWIFLEVNPRLQVEHGVTEAVTGLDLVQLQIRIARGESLEALDVRERGVCIEARICAEDPDAGFAPTPGRVVRFEPALGPGVRVDSGIARGSDIPGDFDSLIVKILASGSDREEARARLVCALRDTDLVVSGGATNKGYLLDLLEDPVFREGTARTSWLDGRSAPSGDQLAEEALVAAGILAYQRNRHAARLNFYSDTSNVSASRVPPSRGQQIDLDLRGVPYRLEVFAIGAWGYRVHGDDEEVAATLIEEGDRAARLTLGERSHRVVHDATDAGLRIEIDGRPYTFGWDTAGRVRASTPAMVVAVRVQPGDEVQRGEVLGVLEAMKMEVSFESPVSGVVKEVPARPGQQVRAGDVLVVIDPQKDEAVHRDGADRVRLPSVRDPLDVLFDGEQPALEAASRAPEEERRRGTLAVREEVRRVVLGYDVNPERADRLETFLEAPLPDDLPEAFRWELAEIRMELTAFADVDRLFVRAPRASVSEEPGPSNQARFRMYVRRMRAAGAGIAEEFLDLVRAALAHYGLGDLTPGDALERAVLRVLASQLAPEPRHRLVLAVLHRVTALGRSGLVLGEDRLLEDALTRIAGMRGLVPHAVADAAAEARYVLFERPAIERLAERTSAQVDAWLDEVERSATAPPAPVLQRLAEAPRSVFDRVGRWVGEREPRRRAIALTAWIRRLYAPAAPEVHASGAFEADGTERFEFAGNRVVLACAAPREGVRDAAESLREAAMRERTSHEWPAVFAIELFVPRGEDEDDEALVGEVAGVLGEGLPAGRFTVNLVAPGGPDLHRTFAPSPDGYRRIETLHGIHPEAAERIDLGRLADFELERCPAPEGIYCFHGRHRQEPGDERLMVLADVRGRSTDGDAPDLAMPVFEHAFYEATRSLRVHLGRRDPKRRLQWNRITLVVRPSIFLEPGMAEGLASRLAPATRHLGLEKVVVRLELLERPDPAAKAVSVEFLISDLTGSKMEIVRRKPNRGPLHPRSEYERRVVEARRRRLVYPYEIVRMLTGSSQATELPAGTFEEWDLDEEGLARSVRGRPYGTNRSAVVFGMVSTPTEKVPSGMRRVLILSDPTVGMGSLAAPECDRVVAAIDLAQAEGLPVEWVAVSSGARIAMDSGTENLDATARVVRRIVTFTREGGAIHLIVPGVNVGAQSYWNALSTMLMHTRGVLIMTPAASMVLTGRAALEASGGVAAEDELGIGGFERIMGPNGEAQYLAGDLTDAYRILYEHYRYSYVVPGESGVRPHATRDPADRPISDQPVVANGNGNGTPFRTVGEIFDPATNPGRKRAFPMRSVMEAVIDHDGGHLERWGAWVGAETAIVWDAHLGGHPITLIGIESQTVPREGYRPLDGPGAWSGGTLFPLSSKKVARALRAASGVRPAVVLANLSGFDGSPESMRKLQLEYGAEIARAVVEFEGPILFLVVARYHGGAYVVFSRDLNPNLRAAALDGSFASVIGGGPAAAVVFTRDVRARASADERVRELQERVGRQPGPDDREQLERLVREVELEKQAEVAAEFDAVHTVERALEVGSLEALVAPDRIRTWLIGELERP